MRHFFTFITLVLSVASSDNLQAIKRLRRETSNLEGNTDTNTTASTTTITSTTTTVTISRTTRATTVVTTKAITSSTKATSLLPKTTTTASAILPEALDSSSSASPTQYSCGKTHWDSNSAQIKNNQCRFLCNCDEGVDCDETSGQCKQLNGLKCPKGYEGDKCQTPICAVNCGKEGFCVHENQCVCTNLYTRVKEEIKHEVHGDIIVHRCASLRLDGLKGALYAIVVLIISISACACMHVTSQKRLKAYSYVDETNN